MRELKIARRFFFSFLSTNERRQTSDGPLLVVAAGNLGPSRAAFRPRTRLSSPSADITDASKPISPCSWVISTAGREGERGREERDERGEKENGKERSESSAAKKAFSFPAAGLLLSSAAAAALVLQPQPPPFSFFEKKIFRPFFLFSLFTTNREWDVEDEIRSEKKGGNSKRVYRSNKNECGAQQKQKCFFLIF